MKNYELFARELINKMTIEEKMGQVSQFISGYKCYTHDENGELQFKQEVYDHIAQYGGIGAISNFLRCCAWTVNSFQAYMPINEREKIANKFQKYLVEKTRLGIPALIEVEANHGLQAMNSVLFPTNIGMGSMFNPELYGEVMRTVGKETRLSGSHVDFVTMLDVARDPRWGRTEECYSEDPYLASIMTEAGVKNIQSEGVICCAKHFIAAGCCAGGRNTAEMPIGERELREIHLETARAAVEAGTGFIMVAYNELDGVPCHVNRHLLQDVLRGELGYEGVLLSDGFAVDRAVKAFEISDQARGAAAVLNAGVDLSLADNGKHYLMLKEAFDKGYFKMEVLDKAIERTLIKKFELGLFDNPYVEEGKTMEYVGTGEQKKLAYESAAESIVMLKNENNTLPLNTDKTVALIGETADDFYYMLGDYASVRENDEGVSVWEAANRTFKKVNFAEGWNFKGKRDTFDAALKAAEESNVVILTLGGSSKRDFKVAFRSNGAAASSLTFLDCGEACDVSDLNLQGNQVEMLCELKKLGKTVIAVLIQGRPYSINEVAELADAVLVAWYPGQQGGDAIIDTIVGKVNPSGKLSISIPTSAGVLPVCYDGKPSINYKYHLVSKNVLYPFGYGLSYSAFEYSNLEVEKLSKNNYKVTVNVTNISEIEGKEVAEMYIHGSEYEITRRVRELKDFKKINLKPHETKKVTFELTERKLQIWSLDNKYEVKPGTVKILVGGDPRKPMLEATITTEQE